MTIRQKCIELAKKIAKERDGYICQKCENDRESRQIQGAHIIPANAKGLIVADPDDIMALCASCHKWAGDSWHEAPLEQKWFEEKFPGRYERLKQKHEIRPIKKYEWEELYEQLLQQSKETEERGD